MLVQKETVRIGGHLIRRRKNGAILTTQDSFEMIYKTIKDLSDTVRRNIYKIPRNIDLVCGVPRSGMLPATMIAEYLNIRLGDIDSLLVGVVMSSGGRGRYSPKGDIKTVLVVEDTLYSGLSMKRTKALLSSAGYNFIFLAVYKEGDAKHAEADIYLEDISEKVKASAYPIALYEWNVFQHHSSNMSHFAFDMDGVLIQEPCDERNYAKYLIDIKEGKPLITPRTEIGLIMTYRLKKHRPQTEQWLKMNGISYKELKMSDYDSYEERRSGRPAGVWKGEYYAQRNDLYLFIESEPSQAETINAISNKPVLSFAENRMIL